MIHNVAIKEDQQDHRRKENKEPQSHEDQTVSNQWKSYGSTWKWDKSEEDNTTAMWQGLGIQQRATQHDAWGEDEGWVYESITTAASNGPGGPGWQKYQVDTEGKRPKTPVGPKHKMMKKMEPMGKN